MKAAARGADGTYGSAADAASRDFWPLPPRYRNRRRCALCGVRKATHTGGANGLAMVSGCELCIRRWVRDGYPTFIDRGSR